MPNQPMLALLNSAVFQRINQQLPTIVSLLLVIACAQLLARLTWSFFPAPDEAVTDVRMVRQNMSAARPDNTIREITSLHLFGQAERVAPNQPQTAPKTRLNLTLRGVIAATPMKSSAAIIAQGKSGNEEIYGIGDKMPGGVTIKEIYDDHVILSRNGKLETLYLEKDEDDNGISISGSEPVMRTPIGSPSQKLSSIRQEILKNPTSFGKYAMPVVVKENGKLVGYRLQPQKNGEKLFQELGLNRSDIITEINGIKMNDPQNALSALQKLSTASSVVIKVKRNGIEVPLSIQLQ